MRAFPLPLELEPALAEERSSSAVGKASSEGGAWGTEGRDGRFDPLAVGCSAGFLTFLTAARSLLVWEASFKKMALSFIELKVVRKRVADGDLLRSRRA